MNGLRVSLLFACRYLFSKKSVNAINIISFISFIGVLVSSAALVIVLSFYNGMESFILSMYSNLAPDLKISLVQGKTFDSSSSQFLNIKDRPDVANYVEVLEDKVLVQYDNMQFVGLLKGIEEERLKEENKEDMLQYGEFNLMTDSIPKALLGAQIQANLRIPINDYFNMMELYFPRKGGAANSLNPLEDFNIRSIGVNGILSYQPEFDDLILVPLSFARDLLDEPEKVSNIEIYLQNPLNTNKIQKEFQKELGHDYQILNREQQNPTLYKTIKSEKWIVFFILTFIGIIAIFNIIGSLTMLVIDKKDDMKILQHLGAERTTIERIFFFEGLMISLFGSTVGLIIGYIFCALQENYGFIRTGDIGSSLIDIYPVDIRYMDFILVFLTIFILSALVSYFSSKLSVKNIGRVTEIEITD